MKPLGDRLLLRVPEAPTRLGQLWLPPAATGEFQLCQAEILERGDGVQDWRLQPGARLVVKRFGRVGITTAGLPDDTFVVREEQVLAILDLPQEEAV